VFNPAVGINAHNKGPLKNSVVIGTLAGSCYSLYSK